MSEADIAWAAGLYEGEGSIFRPVKGKYYPRLTVTLTDPESLETFRNIVGVGAVVGPYPRGLHKPYWNYRLNGLEQVEKVVDLLIPRLSKGRKEQIEKVLDSHT